MARGVTRLCVGAILRRDGHILLGKRTDTRPFYPGVWDLPGGHCEPEEIVEHALARELQEEIGVTPTAWRPLSVLQQPDATRDAYVLHVYLITSWQGTPHNRAPEEHSELAWIALAAAGHLALAHPDYPTLFQQVAAVGKAGESGARHADD